MSSNEDDAGGVCWEVEDEAVEQWCRLHERGCAGHLYEAAAWSEITLHRHLLPRHSLLHPNVRAHLLSYGFASLPDYRTVKRSDALMIACGDIPEGWNPRVKGANYRARVCWYDAAGEHRLTVTYYPEPWRRMAHLRFEDDPAIGSIWDVRC